MAQGWIQISILYSKPEIMNKSAEERDEPILLGVATSLAPEGISLPYCPDPI